MIQALGSALQKDVEVRPEMGEPTRTRRSPVVVRRSPSTSRRDSVQPAIQPRSPWTSSPFGPWYTMSMTLSIMTGGSTELSAPKIHAVTFARAAGSCGINAGLRSAMCSTNGEDQREGPL
jgi:hypothetical protein